MIPKQQIQITDITQPLGGVLFETAAEQWANLRGHWFPVRLVSEDCSENVRDRFAAERWTAGQHLVEHSAESPDVGALINRLAASLLGRHVGRRPQNDACLCHR